MIWPSLGALMINLAKVGVKVPYMSFHAGDLYETIVHSLSKQKIIINVIRLLKSRSCKSLTGTGIWLKSIDDWRSMLSFASYSLSALSILMRRLRRCISGTALLSESSAAGSSSTSSMINFLYSLIRTFLSSFSCSSLLILTGSNSFLSY